MKHDRHAADALTAAVQAAQGARIAQLEIAVLDLLGLVHEMQRVNDVFRGALMAKAMREAGGRA